MWFLFTTLNIIQSLSSGVIAALIAVGVLLFFSALISGAEVAFFSIDPILKDELKADDSRKSTMILDQLNKPKRLLATILIANNFINVAIVIISTYINVKLFAFVENPVLSFAIQVVAVTFLILLFGEVIPKVYATQNPIKLAGITVFPIFFLGKFFRPLSYVLVTSTSFITSKVKQKQHNISVDELSDALELAGDDTLEEEQILKGIVKFGSTDVKQIMKPRIDVIALAMTTEYNEVIATILECGYSRLPVFEESMDKVKGILYIKDLLPGLELNSDNEPEVKFTANKDGSWQSLLRTPFFVPENKKIDDLLKEFQEKKIHLAIVVDEYGGTSGIVTLEDIIEEIVGEISDEYDDDELAYSKLDDNTFVFDGKTALNDLYRALDIEGTSFEDAKGESDSLAGFIIELEGKIPLKNEKITFENYRFTIEAADLRRVKRVKVTILSDIKEAKE
ncbi:MAG: gliding motility-associated protein GldE [Flavobacteriales bacterium]|nr:gliding motility-associated protein GldE [Flavobacteriales bacterium]